MTKTNYANELNRAYLENLGITEVSNDGHIYAGAFELPQATINTNKHTKQYRIVNVKDPDTGKLKSFGVHRVVAAWHMGCVPDGMVVDHINNDSLDNRLENLQIITQAENTAKDAKHHTAPLKCNLNKPLSFYQDKLDVYVQAYEAAKENHDAKLAHDLRCNISQTRARIAYYKLHLDEAYDLALLKYYREKDAAAKKLTREARKALRWLIENARTTDSKILIKAYTQQLKVIDQQPELVKRNFIDLYEAKSKKFASEN